MYQKELVCANLIGTDLATTTRSVFVPFEEAYAEVMSFIDRLDLPKRL